MGNDKSIVEKITGTMKDIADIAADAARHALQEDKPPRKAASQSEAAYMPLAVEGLISDPFMVPPIAVAPVPRRRRLAPKPAAKKASKGTKAKTAKKSLGKAARKSGIKRSSKTAKKNAKKVNRKIAKKPAKKARKGRRA